jgi:hypothetical protein
MATAAQCAPEPDVLAHALEYAGRGWKVFPCRADNKRPHTTNGFHDASADPAVIRGWWSRWPNAMIGAPTGPSMGAWVLDIDDPATFSAACDDMGIVLPSTRCASTGKGLHHYFEWDATTPIRNAQQDKKGWPFPDLPGAEVRGDGGYIILPPSLHPLGRRYEWIRDEDPSEAPDDLLNIIRQGRSRQEPANKKPADNDEAPDPVEPPKDGKDTRYGLAALKAECDGIARAGEGSQENTLNAASLKIGALVAGGELTFVTAARQLLSTAMLMPSYNPRDPWDPTEIADKVKRGLRDGMREPRKAPPRTPGAMGKGKGVTLDDFRAYMPTHQYIFTPSGEPWPASSVNSRIPPIPLLDADGAPVINKKGEEVMILANQWLDEHRPVEQMTWAPGEPKVIDDRLISDGGWIDRPGCHCFNLYRPPVSIPGDASQVKPWVDHIQRIYPEDAAHIIKWLAHRVQRPHEKINHALVLGGLQGVGKDTLLEPVKLAIGPWNFAEVSPQHLLGRFNGFVRSVILRVSEARDLGDIDRFAFYDHMKTYTAAPPDVLRVDEKHLREYAVFNVCGVIITSNHKSDGIYLPSDDRRHYVAWSEAEKEQFSAEYWTSLYGWYQAGGNGHVAAYLRELDLSDFNAKAPPPKTPAFWDIVSANRAPEDAELADALDKHGYPSATSLTQIMRYSSETFAAWLGDRRNSRKVPHRLEECGYVPCRNTAAKDGLWKVNGARSVIYVKRELSIRDAHASAEKLVEHSRNWR